jgi:membrane protein YdbS with pleckstrin-like domain
MVVRVVAATKAEAGRIDNRRVQTRVQTKKLPHVEVLRKVPAAPDCSMSAEEKVLFKGSSSPFMLAGLLGALGAAELVLIVLGFVLSLWLLLLALVPLAVAGWALLVLKSRVYEVTTERIRISTGLLTRRTDELELYRVKDMTLVEPPVHRMFKLGNLVLQTSDTTSPTLTLEAIANPTALRESLRISIEECRARNRVRLTELE